MQRNNFLKNLKFFKRIIGLPFLYLLYLLSFFFPRKKNIWVLGCNKDGFSDNTKYFYLYLCELKSRYKDINIDFYWITSNKEVYKSLKRLNYPVLLRWSFKGVLFSLRAGVYIYNHYLSDVNYWTSAKSFKINLWHGIPLKKIEFDITTGPLSKRYHNFFWKMLYRIIAPEFIKKPDYILSTSHFISEILSSAFRINKEQCIEVGYPRCDIFFNKNINKTKTIEENLALLMTSKKKYNKQYILFLPTFRDDKQDILNLIDFNKINQILINSNYILIIKPHPNSNFQPKDEYPNIIFLEKNLDIYPILPYIDILISDYSSIIFDYLLLEKPIYLYTEDEDKYNKVRGFYPEIKTIIDTEFVKYKDFAKLIEDITFNKIAESPKNFKKLINIFWENYRKGEASKSLFIKLNKLLKI